MRGGEPYVLHDVGILVDANHSVFNIADNLQYLWVGTILILPVVNDAVFRCFDSLFGLLKYRK